MSGALLAGAILFALLGCACLALSQDRHWEAVAGSRRPRSKLPRNAGCLLLAASLATAVARDGLSFGILFWPMLLGLGALVTAVALTWRPQAMKPLAMLFRRA